MALSSAVISYDISDMVGTDFDARRTKIWVTTNVDGDTVIDTAGNQIRVGDGLGTIAENGTGSVSVWIPGAGANPTSWQTYVHLDHGDRRPAAAGGKRAVRTFGPFTITGDANLADLIAEQEVPPTYLSQVTADLQQYVDSAEDAANEAQTALDNGIAEVEAALAAAVALAGPTPGLALDTDGTPYYDPDNPVGPPDTLVLLSDTDSTPYYAGA